MPEQKTTVASWKKAGLHDVMLPSGTTITIKIPDLPALIEAGEIPQNLLDVAMLAANGTPPTISAEAMGKEREFTERLVRITVVEPALSEEDVKSIPFEDKDKIVALATRQHDFDSEGNHIGGLDKSEKFRKFRQIGEFRPSLEDL